MLPQSLHFARFRRKQHLPSHLHCGFQRLLPGLNPWRVVFFRRFDGRVPEQNRDDLQRNALFQEIDRERIP
jgi:hypothetical protein